MGIARTPLEVAVFESGLTRVDIAKATGLNRTLVSQIVCGRVVPTAYEKKVIAEALGKRVQTLFPVREEMTA
jgi:transcriptional regulator with XRE-family HTH domain